MNTHVISGKLAVITVFFALSILIWFSFKSIQSRDPLLTICNVENTLTSVLNLQSYQIVINPVSKPQTIECLGKIIPFYDKTIEVLITNDTKSIDLLSKYYHLKKILKKDIIKINFLVITIDSNQTTIYTKNNMYVINRRPLTSLFKLTAKEEKIIQLIRPISMNPLEQFLKQLNIKQNIVNEGQVENIVLDRF